MARVFKLLSLAVVLSLGLLFTMGCGTSKAKLRVVSASPDAPNLDILVDGKTIQSNKPYANASSYVSISSGSRQIEVRATGTTTDLINTTQTFSGNTNYTLLIESVLATITPVVVTDSTTTPASGQFQIRAIHAAPSSGNVDIYVEPPGTDITTVSPTQSNVPFESATQYLSMAAGNVEIFVTPANVKTVIYDSGSIPFTAGQVRSGVLLDAPGGGAPFTVIYLADLN